MQVMHVLLIDLFSRYVTGLTLQEEVGTFSLDLLVLINSIVHALIMLPLLVS